VCKEADRTGKVIDGRIQPDELIVSGSNQENDLVKAAAVMFLQMQ
jgi:hypothetical protein